MGPGLRQRFRLLVLLQLALLLVGLTTMSYLLLRTDYSATLVVLLAVLVIQIIVLFNFLESSTRTLNEFLEAVFFSDFTRQFSREHVDEELSGYFNQILERFRAFRASGESQGFYLDTLVKQVPIPLVSIRGDGSIALLNKPFKQLVGMSGLKSIDQLRTAHADFPDQLASIRAGERRLIQTSFYNRPLELRLSATELRLSPQDSEGATEKLITIENLSGELHEREASAWTRLIRVLTHEIMNTLTPVTSLAQTARGIVVGLDPKSPDPESLEDLQSAISTISQRSESLTRFVERYREYLNIPQPEFKQVHIDSLLKQVIELHAADLTQAGIHITRAVEPPDLNISADADLIDKVLINLLKNAMEALKDTDKPRIEIQAKFQHGHVLILIRDNGPGMADEVRENMFVPFYTTKRDGSGIGLSVARQVMRAHGGEILVDSAQKSSSRDTDCGTTISLLF